MSGIASLTAGGSEAVLKFLKQLMPEVGWVAWREGQTAAERMMYTTFLHVAMLVSCCCTMLVLSNNGCTVNVRCATAGCG
jgi:hypothetical protein